MTEDNRVNFGESTENWISCFQQALIFEEKKKNTQIKD